MIIHENRLLADDFHEISYLIFFRKLEKVSQNLLSAAVVIGALRVKTTHFSFLIVQSEILNPIFLPKRF